MNEERKRKKNVLGDLNLNQFRWDGHFNEWWRITVMHRYIKQFTFFNEIDIHYMPSSFFLSCDLRTGHHTIWTPMNSNGETKKNERNRKKSIAFFFCVCLQQKPQTCWINLNLKFWDSCEKNWHFIIIILS